MGGVRTEKGLLLAAIAFRALEEGIRESQSVQVIVLWCSVMLHELKFQPLHFPFPQLGQSDHQIIIVLQ